MSNIVFFGQADAGKSTLAGYIISKYDPNFRLSMFVHSLKKVKEKIDMRLVFSSIINTNKDEVEDSQRLNSRALHLRRISLPLESVTIIDTPGSEGYRKQRERGIFYANIGIFFMEINKILDQEYRINTIAPIALWSKLKNKRMMFLLTKFDMVNYSEKAYLQALDEVKRICYSFDFDGAVTIIPTAVEVDKMKDMPIDQLDDYDFGENICSKSGKMPWYNGLSVVEAIEAEINALDAKDAEEPLLFCVTDQINRPSNRAGKVWNIKILSGILRAGQEICISPVKDTRNNCCTVKATVKQLRLDISRFETEEEVQVARKGNIYGLDIKQCSVEGHYITKNGFDAISSTCGFDQKTRFLMSDCVVFGVETADQNAFKEKKEMRLVWFGHSIPFKIEEIDHSDNSMKVYGRLKSTQIAIPLYNNDSIIQRVLVRGDGLEDFYNCTLLELGF